MERVVNQIDRLLHQNLTEWEQPAGARNDTDSGEAHRKDGEKDAGATADNGWWSLDTVADLHVTGNFAESVSYTEDAEKLQCIRGVFPTIIVRIAGAETVTLTAEMDEDQVVTYLYDVLYIPDAEYGFFSPGLAREQGFNIEMDNATFNFAISKEVNIAAVGTPQDANWDFQVMSPTNRLKAIAKRDHVVQLHNGDRSWNIRAMA